MDEPEGKSTPSSRHFIERTQRATPVSRSRAAASRSDGDGPAATTGRFGVDAQAFTTTHMANHAPTWTTQLYDRRHYEVSLDEVEQILI